MMKTRYLLPLALLVALASCSKEGDDTVRVGDAFRVTSKIIQTRSTNQDLQNTQFIDGSKVGLFVTNNASQPVMLYDNRELTADGYGNFSTQSGEEMYYGPDSHVNLYAYHPYEQGTLLGNSMAFSVYADQNFDDAFKRSDLMWGTPTSGNPVARKTANVPITFKHKLSKVIAQLTSGVGSPSLKDATVRILGTKPGTTLDLNTGVLTAASGDAAPIRMATFDINATTYNCSAVVIPQALVTGSQFIEVILANGGKLYYSVPNAGITLAEGKSYTYNITVNLTSLTVTSQVTDWIEGNGGGEEGGATMPDAIGTIDASEARIGDFYFSDGTFAASTATLTAKQKAACIGVVMRIGKDETDKGNYVDVKGRSMSSIHGYVVALRDAADGKIKWYGNNESFTSNMTTGKADDWQGYYNSMQIKQYVIDNSDWTMNDLLAVSACLNFSENYPQYAAPNASSGWFLPSINQLRHLFDNQSTLSVQVGKTINESGDNGHCWCYEDSYWASTIQNTSFQNQTVTTGFSFKVKGWFSGGTNCYVRPILVF